MSLINDALKKAQRQQSGGAPGPEPAGAPTPGGHTPRIERREKPADFRSQMLILGGVSVGLLIALVVGGFFWWRSSHPGEPAAPQQVAQTSTSATTPAKPVTPEPAKAEPKPEPVKIETAPAAPAANTTASAGSPQFTLPLAPQSAAQPASTSAAPASTAASTTPTVQLPASTPPADAVKLPPAERPKASTQMIKAIEAFRVTGIRASGGESKVLMNDRVYRIGDTVDIELGIKLTGVAQGALTFEDGRGAVHTRSF